MSRRAQQQRMIVLWSCVGLMGFECGAGIGASLGDEDVGATVPACTTWPTGGGSLLVAGFAAPYAQGRSVQNWPHRTVLPAALMGSVLNFERGFSETALDERTACRSDL